MHHDARVAIDQDVRLVAARDDGAHRGRHHLADAAEEVARHHERAFFREQDVREAGARAAASQQTDFLWDRFVERRHHFARIDVSVLDRKFSAVLKMADELLLRFSRAIACLFEDCFASAASSASTPSLASVWMYVGARVAHQHVRLGIEVHELRVRV